MQNQKIDQTTMLDLLEQQAPAYKVNFAIGALNAQIEQIEDELEPMTANLDDLTVKQMDVYDRLTERLEKISRLERYLTIHRDGDKAIRLMEVVYSRWTDDDQAPELAADLRYVKEILTGEIDL